MSGGVRNIGSAARDLPDVTYIREAQTYDYDFTFCSLVASQDKYDLFLGSCVKAGYNNQNSQFLALDNRGANRFDGYSSLRRAIPEARGRYIVFTHDDVEFVDTYENLLGCLTALTVSDSRWVLAGNAGSPVDIVRFGKMIAHIDDPNISRRIEESVQVQSLDENFFILRADRLVLNSFDLEGFHYYASDLCLQAEFLGGTAYVIPYLLFHGSRGNTDDVFMDSTRLFRQKYSKFFNARRYKTPCGEFILGSPSTQLRLENKWRKYLGRLRRLKSLIRDRVTRAPG